jgi:hypothetical protein
MEKTEILNRVRALTAELHEVVERHVHGLAGPYLAGIGAAAVLQVLANLSLSIQRSCRDDAVPPFEEALAYLREAPFEAAMRAAYRAVEGSATAVKH